RLSDAEREALVALLRRHLEDGRLELDEFSDRVGALFRARTREEADRSFAGLPALPVPATGPAGPAGRGRYGEGPSGAAPGWQPTPEVFRDPTTGRVMRVWVDPADGSRHYVGEG
ncbi:MAG: DUF1707 domain-containing protein, partial [Acidimicrobiales bacterium]